MVKHKVGRSSDYFLFPSLSLVLTRKIENTKWGERQTCFSEVVYAFCISSNSFWCF